MLAHCDAFIFDLDGTLVESSLDFRVIKREVGCPADIDLLDHIDALPGDQQANAMNLVEHYEWLDAQQANLIDGVQPFLSKLHEHGVKTAIVTRNCEKATQTKLAKNDLNFEYVITRDDALPKPHPEAILKLLGWWSIPAARAAYVGDYIYDLQAAKNAEVYSLLFAPAERPEFAHLADRVFSCWHQLGTDWQQATR